MSKPDFDTPRGRFDPPPAPWNDRVSAIWAKAWSGLQKDWMVYDGKDLNKQLRAAEREAEYAQDYSRLFRS